VGDNLVKLELLFCWIHLQYRNINYVGLLTIFYRKFL